MVISFHSLEDRIVKQFIARHSREVFDRRAPFAAPKADEAEGAGARQAVGRRSRGEPALAQRDHARGREDADERMTDAPEPRPADRADRERACTWCSTQYESRRLFTEIDKAAGARRASSRSSTSGCRSEKRAPGDAVARGEAGQGAVADARRRRRPSRSTSRWRRARLRSRAAGCPAAAASSAMSRSVAYTSSPLLASRTPVWRSKFIVGRDRAGLRRRWPAAPPGSRCSPTIFSRSRARCASPARWSCRPTAAASSTATA